MTAISQKKRQKQNRRQKRLFIWGDKTSATAFGIKNNGVKSNVNGRGRRNKKSCFVRLPAAKPSLFSKTNALRSYIGGARFFLICKSYGNCRALSGYFFEEDIEIDRLIAVIGVIRIYPAETAARLPQIAFACPTTVIR